MLEPLGGSYVNVADELEGGGQQPPDGY